MKYELGDHSYVRCPENHLSADIEFKVKGWVSGGYNAIGGYIKNDKTGENLYELSGVWTGEMYAKDLKTGKKILLFDASHTKHTPPKARPVQEQGERESQRLWQKVCQAVHVADHNVATDEKAKIEDRQRQEAHDRQEQGVEWHPKLFRRVESQPGGREEGEEDLEWIINTDMYGQIAARFMRKKLTYGSDPRAPPQQIVEQILAIAPILPGQNNKPKEQVADKKSNAAPPPAKPQPQAQHAPDNLIDFNSRPSSTAPPENRPDPLAGNPLHPTSNPKQIPPIHEATTITAPGGNASRGGNFLDDDRHLNDKMASMSMQQPLQPSSGRPIRRTDTETSELDEFVDAQG